MSGRITRTANKTKPRRANAARPQSVRGRSAHDAVLRYLEIAAVMLERDELSASALFQEMASRTDIPERSKRTIERDLRFVTQEFMPAFKRTLRASRMLGSEALLHELVAQHLDMLLPPSAQRAMKESRAAARQVLRNMGPLDEARWRSRVAALSPDSVQAAPVLDAQLCSVVSDALFRGRKLSLGYQSASQTVPTPRRLNPLGLVLRHPSLYLIACADDPEKVGWYAVHRMTEVKALEELAEEPKNFDLGRFLEDDPGFGARHGPIKLSMDVDEFLARRLRERPLPAQKIRPTSEEGWFRVDCQLEWTDQLFVWLRSWGSSVCVHKPKLLARKLAEDLGAAYEFYA